MNYDITIQTSEGERILIIPADITSFEAAKLAHILTIGAASLAGGYWTGQMIWQAIQSEKIDRLFPLVANKPDSATKERSD